MAKSKVAAASGADPTNAALSFSRATVLQQTLCLPVARLADVDVTLLLLTCAVFGQVVGGKGEPVNSFHLTPLVRLPASEVVPQWHTHPRGK